MKENFLLTHENSLPGKCWKMEMCEKFEKCVGLGLAWNNVTIKRVNFNYFCWHVMISELNGCCRCLQFQIYKFSHCTALNWFNCY